MDALLSNVSVDGFKLLAVIVSSLVGVGVFFGFFKRWYWALFASIFTYMILTAGVGVYVLMHISDARWAVGREPLLEAPSVGDTPVIGEMMRPLDDFMRDAAMSINQLTSFRHALPVAQDFFALSGWALLVLIPVAIMALVISRFRSATLFLRFEQLAATVQAQGREIENLRRASTTSGGALDGSESRHDDR